MTSCPCTDTVFIRSLGETVCQSCGLVLSCGQALDMLDTSCGWPLAGGEGGGAWGRLSDAAQDQSRVGMPCDALLPQVSLSTCIAGRSLAASRLRLLNLHHLSYNERLLLRVFRQISSACSQLGLKYVVLATAKSLFAAVRQAAGMRRGAVFRAMPAASTYFAAKLRGCFRPPEMLCAAFGVSLADFSRCSKVIVDCSRGKPFYATLTAPPDATSLVALVINTLAHEAAAGLYTRRAEVRRTALRLHELVMKRAPELAGQQVLALVTAEVAVACELHGLPCSQASAASTCAGVSQVTLRRYLREVRSSLPAC